MKHLETEIIFDGANDANRKNSTRSTLSGTTNRLPFTARTRRTIWIPPRRPIKVDPGGIHRSESFCGALLAVRLHSLTPSPGFASSPPYASRPPPPTPPLPQAPAAAYPPSHTAPWTIAFPVFPPPHTPVRPAQLVSTFALSGLGWLSCSARWGVHRPTAKHNTQRSLPHSPPRAMSRPSQRCRFVRSGRLPAHSTFAAAVAVRAAAAARSTSSICLNRHIVAHSSAVQPSLSTVAMSAPSPTTSHTQSRCALRFVPAASMDESAAQRDPTREPLHTRRTPPRGASRSRAARLGDAGCVDVVSPSHHPQCRSHPGREPGASCDAPIPVPSPAPPAHGPATSSPTNPQPAPRPWPMPSAPPEAWGAGTDLLLTRKVGDHRRRGRPQQVRGAPRGRHRGSGGRNVNLPWGTPMPWPEEADRAGGGDRRMAGGNQMRRARTRRRGNARPASGGE